MIVKGGRFLSASWLKGRGLGDFGRLWATESHRTRKINKVNSNFGDVGFKASPSLSFFVSVCYPCSANFLFPV